MRTQDLRKLKKEGQFRLFRLNETGNNSFVLKEYVDNDDCLWKIISSKDTYDKIMKDFLQFRDKITYPLLCSNRFTTFDLQEISLRGFCILRENNERTLSVEEYNRKTLKWEIKTSFDNLPERCAFMNQQLKDTYTISIDA